MNYKDRLIKGIGNLNLVKKSSLNGTRINSAKYWKGTSYEHYRVMSDIVFKLCKDYNAKVYTEVEFNNNSRADIYAILPNGDSVIIEVLHTETEKRFDNKSNTYPEEIPIIRVETRDFNIDNFCI